jgi:hypothetical protein
MVGAKGLGDELAKRNGLRKRARSPGTSFPAVLREPFDLVIARYAATSFFDQLNSVPCEMAHSLVRRKRGKTNQDSLARLRQAVGLGPRVYEKTLRNRVVEIPTKRAILGARLAV